MIVKSKSMKNLEPIKIPPKASSLFHPPHEQAHPEMMRADLRQILWKFIQVPLHIEVIYWMYFSHIFFSICETLARIPFDIVFGAYNSLAVRLTLPKIKLTSLFAWLIILGSLVVTRDIYYLDISVLYHSFRGQSTVKLYGAGLALQISEKVLTLAGKFLLSRLQLILMHSENNRYPPLLELSLCFCYTLLHFLSLYLDFILFIIVINSSNNNMLMFFFVVNLGKMKAATFKKFEKKNFRNSVVFDAKERFHKITYAVLFMITTPDRANPASLAVIILIISCIDYLRHLVNLSMASKQEEVCFLRAEMLDLLYNEREEDQYRYSVATSLEWDFTVVPYILLLVKFASIWVGGNFAKWEWVLTHGYVLVLASSMLLSRIVMFMVTGRFPTNSKTGLQRN